MRIIYIYVYDMKLKKPARRNENIYDLDCYPCQEESDQRVNQIEQARLLNYSTTAVLL